METEELGTTSYPGPLPLEERLKAYEICERELNEKLIAAHARSWSDLLNFVAGEIVTARREGAAKAIEACEGIAIGRSGREYGPPPNQVAINACDYIADAIRALSPEELTK